MVDTTARLFVDGTLRSSRGWTGSPGPTTTTQALSLARYAGASTPYFAGSIDDARVYSRALTDTEIQALAGAASGPENVVWTSLVNATASGNSLQKTGGCDGCDDAGGLSQQQITSGDGYVELTATGTGLRFAGLSNGQTGTAYTEVDFAFRLGQGLAEVRENGIYRADAPLVSGDIFRVAVEGGQVKYYRNGSLMHTSAVAPTYPLRLGTSLLSASSAVTAAVIQR